MKRLAELDAKNPNIVKESTSVAECGPMGMMDGMGSTPNTPASINMTAGSGDELANMLATIMQLAGVKQVGADDINGATEPSVMSDTPIMGVDSSDGEEMRSVIDKMHDTDDEEETEEGEYDNSPSDPTDPPRFDANEFSQNTNDGDGNTSNGKRRTGMQPTATFESLMKDYKSFIGETTDDEDEEEVEEGMMDKIKAGAKTAAKAVGKAITGPDDEELVQRLEKQTGGKRPSNIPTPVKTNESTTLDILKLSGLRK